MSGQRRQPARALGPMKWFFSAFVILVLNSGYLAAFAEPTVFYMLNVMLHVVLGTALVMPFFIFVRRFLENDAPKGKELAVYMGKLGYWCLAPCVLTGLYLVVVNATHLHRWILYFHIAAGFIGVAFFQKAIRSVAHKVSTKNPYDAAGRWAWVVVVIAVFVPLLAGIYNWVFPREGERIVNPAVLQKKQDPVWWNVNNFFAPSAVSTPAKKNISSQSFLNSKSCSQSRCHADIYRQWQSSAHHYSSFNNPWYRKSLEHLLETSRAHADTNNPAPNFNPAKWCAGCHDPALLVSGKFERPALELAKLPEAHVGVACTVCHSITRVSSTMGQADYMVEEMPLHDWATSENELLRELYNFLLRVDPEPHRRSMMKPFHREDSAEFCSSCHKSHFDKPLNQSRWIRNFNDYDAWQAGPFSGRSSRGFYSARDGKTCVDCHMPLTASTDAGNLRGKVHSHRFLGANTALPAVNQDQSQLDATIEFLRNRQVSVDIFALGKPYNEELFYGAVTPAVVSKVDSPLVEERNRFSPLPNELALSTLFAIGDEQRFALGLGGLTRYPSEVIAPLDQGNVVVNRGDEVRIEVVVRSQKVGHFFPSGTVDAHDVWLELQATDDRGRIIFWSGAVADGGNGPVDSTAHFYRSYLIDDAGNHIDKNNTWAAREAVYVNLIPAGGAEVAHYRLKIPADCGNQIHLVARLNHRKFSWQQTQWTFTGLPFPSSNDFSVSADLAVKFQNGSGATIPELPIVEMARDEVTLAVIDPDSTKPTLPLKNEPRDWERWNDYGMGLLRQGDLKSAEAAFLRVAQISPNPAEAWINVGVVRLQEGNIEAAKQALETALYMNPSLHKLHFYYGLTLKAQGKYDEALKYLKKVINKFPRDRVARNERGHLYLLMKDYPKAILDFEKVLSMDPENLEAYHHLKNAYRAVGEEGKAKKAETLYERFKANAPSFPGHDRTNTAQHVWRERQPIHEHFSVAPPFK